MAGQTRQQVRFDFTGERFVVTGASSGMGRQVARELAEAGAVVLALGRNVERLEQLRAECPERIVPARLDVCDAVALEDAVQSFTAEYGKLAGGVHAAGTSGLTPLKSHDTEMAQEMMRVSFWAGMTLLRLVTKSRYGKAGTSTVLFSSVCALSHEKGMFAYAAAKAAVDSGLRAAAKEICTRGHRVNSVLPGWVQSAMTEQLGEQSRTDAVFNRHLLGQGSPADVSGMVLFLLSDRARWITGGNFVVDGGYLA